MPKPGEFILRQQKNRQVRIGVFPDGEKALILRAGGGEVARHHIGSSQAKMRQRVLRADGIDPRVGEDLFVLRDRRTGLFGLEIGLGPLHRDGIVDQLI